MLFILTFCHKNISCLSGLECNQAISVQVALDVRDLDPVKFGDELEAARKEHERRLKHASACELDSEDEAECYIQYGDPSYSACHSIYFANAACRSIFKKSSHMCHKAEAK